jgi:hypothetical protein
MTREILKFDQLKESLEDLGLLAFAVSTPGSVWHQADGPKRTGPGNLPGPVDSHAIPAAYTLPRLRSDRTGGRNSGRDRGSFAISSGVNILVPTVVEAAGGGGGLVTVNVNASGGLMVGFGFITSSQLDNNQPNLF